MNAKIALWMSWTFFLGFAIGSWAWAQAPQTIPGCTYNLTAPTLTTGQTVSLQCDSNGKLRVTTS